MRKWMWACAIVVAASFWTEVASAQEPIQAPTQVMVTPTPTTTTVVRTGLFGRVRARRQMTVVSEPMPASSMTTPTKMTTLTPAQATQTPSTVQQAQYPPLQGGTQPTPATMPATSTTMPATVMPMQTVEPRVGLLARLRARRGY